MHSIEFTENLFRSIDTIVAERIKSLPYDITQLVEIVDDTNANAGIYTVTSNHQNKEIVYSDNPTYENGDKVYILNTADNKERRFILGLYQRNTTGRTDRVLSILDGSLNSLKQNLSEQMDNGFKGLEETAQDLDWKFGRTADGILSLIEDKEAGLKTAISQTAKEIRLEAESTYEGLNASLSITAREIRSEVHDFAAGLESIISETAGEIRQEVNDYYNNLFANLSITAGAIRSEVIDKTNQLESNITETAGEIRHEVKDLRNQLETSISQTAYEIRSEAHDLQHGLQSEISQTAERITSQVVDLDQGLSIVTQTATEIDSKVIDLQDNFSDISQTATAITQRVTNIEGDFSLLEQTANQISSRVEAVEGNFSEIKQTANEISSRVEDVEGNYSEIVQNVNGITSTVENLEKDLRTRISQTDTNIALEIEDREKGINSLKGTIDGWTFQDTNPDGSHTETTINGDKIATGTIDASKIKAESFDVIHKDAQNNIMGRLGMHIGSISESDASGNVISVTPTYGAAIYGKNETYVITATEAGARMSNTTTKKWINKDGEEQVYSDPDVAIYVSGDSAVMYSNGNQVKVSTQGITSSDNVHTISDRRMKHTISYDLSNYENFYNRLQPVSYIYNFDQKNKKHIGFIYQDIETSLLHSGLTSSDFAGVYKEYNDDGSIWCGLGYTEFIALNTHMIQKTRKELEEKNNKIQQLENRIDELEQKLNLLLETLS